MTVEENREIIINEKTLLPVSLVVVIIGGVFWLTTLHSKVNATEKQLEVISSGLESTGKGSIKDQLKEHGESLARIEGFLKNDRNKADK